MPRTSPSRRPTARPAARSSPSTASASIDTSFMKMMGYSSLNIGSSSTVKWGNNRLRVALALDNTGSMAKQQDDRAQDREEEPAQHLKAAANDDGDIKVSIVPFSKKSTSAPLTTTPPGSTGRNGKTKTATNRHDLQEHEDLQEQQDEGAVHDLDHLGAGQPQHLERLRDRPR